MCKQKFTRVNKKESVSMKKLFFLTVLLVTVLACGKNANKSNDEVVTVWAWDRNFNVSIMEKAAKKYEATNPGIKIEVLDFARADIETKLNIGLSSGARSGLPEIVLIEDYSAKKYISSYPGYFSNLKGKIDHSKFADYKVEAMTEKGGIYGVPFDSGVTGFFYRKDIMEKAGFTDQDLNNITWERFIEIAQVVRKKTGVHMVPGDLLGDAGLLRIMMQSAGQWYFDRNGNVNIANNQALKEAFKVMQAFEKNNVMRPTSGWGEWVGAMNKGEAASVVTGIWIMGSIKAETAHNALWRIASTPKLNNINNAVNASNLGGSSWYVLEKSPNRDIAIDFLNTIFAGDNEFYQQILVENGAMGTYLPSQKGSAYLQRDEFFGGQAVYEDFSKWVQKIPAVNYGAFVSEADSVVLAALRRVINENESIDASLKRAENELKAIIK